MENETNPLPAVPEITAPAPVELTAVCEVWCSPEYKAFKTLIEDTLANSNPSMPAFQTFYALHQLMALVPATFEGE